ncbi:hypothetical protein JGD95_25670 [Salmonella enterica subsp. enterica serovar Typhimurium]|nr:hypothetical protein [Salmonella enterica subsp. enterica serovar Typhimurium]
MKKMIESRMTQIQEREDDEDMTPIDTTIFAMLAVPSTRARTLHLTYQVSSFLDVSLYYMNYMMLPNDGIYIYVQHHVTFGPRQASSSSGTRFGIQFGLRNQPDSINLKQP